MPSYSLTAQTLKGIRDDFFDAHTHVPMGSHTHYFQPHPPEALANALANAKKTILAMEAVKPKQHTNCPNCGATWDGSYCSYHEQPRKPVTLGVTVAEATKAFRALSGTYPGPR